MFRSFITFFQLILQGNMQRSVWRICMWILGLNGLNSGIPGPGEDSLYERGGDDRRLAQGVLGKTLLYLAVKVSFRVALEEIVKHHVFSIRVIYSIHVIKVSNHRFQGSKKGWATPRFDSFRGLIQNFRRAFPPLSYAEFAPPLPRNTRFNQFSEDKKRKVL